MRFITVADARRLAKWRLPKIFFDYIDGGASSETTLRANEADYERYALRQRVLVDVADRSLATTFLGRTHALPFGLGPVGYTGLFAPCGEIQAARAAVASDIPFSLSNFGIATLDEVRAASTGALYAQIYVLRDREETYRMIDRATAAGAEALIVTVDTAVTGARERDERNGFRGLTHITPRLALQFAARPRWCASVLRGGLPEVGIARGRPEYGRGVLAQSGHLARLIDPSLTWSGLATIRRRWAGRLVLKGILTAEDARQAVGIGADAIVVSNHGGRQLDHAPSTIAALPAIATAVGREIEVLVDGGIRRGTQIVKALALGAQGVLLGRAYAFALAADGERGVRTIVERLAGEISVTLALMGLRSIDELRRVGAEVLIESRQGLATSPHHLDSAGR